MEFRYIALEGPPCCGKTLLAERLASRLDAMLVLEDRDNPFLADFHAGRIGAALQSQLFFLLSRHKQQVELRQGQLFQATVSDVLFDRDKIHAYLNLDDNELFIYQRLFDLLQADVPTPDLVIYLQTPTDTLLRRLKQRRSIADGGVSMPTADDLRELNEAYQHYFFHYASTPLLVVEMSALDGEPSAEDIEDLLRQISQMGPGTQYYVPRTS